jgi:hypothetical protein
MTVRDTGAGAAPEIRVENDIVVHDLSGISHLSLELMRTLYKQRVHRVGKSPKSVAIIASDVLTVDFEVQIYASNPLVQASTQAVAVIGDSFMLQHLTSMFLSYHAPSYPVRLFGNIGDAMRWLSCGNAESAGEEA